MPNWGQGVFDGVSGSDVFQMLSGNIIDCQSHVAVFGQFGDSLVVFHTLCRYAEVKRGLSVDTDFNLPDLVLMALCLGLYRLRYNVQHVACFVEPAARLFRFAKDLAR